MKWTTDSLDCLKKTFRKAPFSAKQAIALLKEEMGYSNNASYQVLHGLVKDGLLIKLGRGIYVIVENRVAQREAIGFSDRVTVTFTSGVLIRAEQLLKEKGVEFMITGPSALSGFHHLLPRRLIHLIYVIDGAGEFATDILRKDNIQTLLNPKRGEVETALESLPERDVFIIREFANLEGNVNGRALIERAIVDVYFEVTRRRIPFSELEVGRIIANIFRTEKIDISRLLTFASRRGIRREFESVVSELMPELKLHNDFFKSAQKVIEGIRS